MTSPVVTTKARSRAAFVLLGVAIVLSLMLAFGGNSAPGGGQGCWSVLASKWSSIAGIPVGLLGALFYASVLVCGFVQRAKWIFVMSSALVLGAALWFGVLQLVVFRAVNLVRCLVDACAVTGAFLLPLNAPSRATGSLSWEPVALAGVLMALVGAVHTGSSARDVLSAEHIEASVSDRGSQRSWHDWTSEGRVSTPEQSLHAIVSVRLHPYHLHT